MFLDAPDRAPGMLRLRDVPPTSKQAVRIRAQAAMRRTEKHRLAESMRALRPNGGTLGLTRNQARCLDFIRRYIGERGASPSYDEIRLAMGFANRSAVFRIVGSSSIAASSTAPQA